MPSSSSSLNCECLRWCLTFRAEGRQTKLVETDKGEATDLYRRWSLIYLHVDGASITLCIGLSMDSASIVCVRPLNRLSVCVVCVRAFNETQTICMQSVCHWLASFCSKMEIKSTLVICSQCMGMDHWGMATRTTITHSELGEGDEMVKPANWFGRCWRIVVVL